MPYDAASVKHISIVTVTVCFTAYGLPLPLRAVPLVDYKSSGEVMRRALRHQAGLVNEKTLDLVQIHATLHSLTGPG